MTVKGITVFAALAGVLAVALVAPDPGQASVSDIALWEKSAERCFGVARAGRNDGPDPGQSPVDGDGEAWIIVPKGTCHRIVGGRAGGLVESRYDDKALDSFQRCAGVARAGLNDGPVPGASQVDGDRDAWISLPKGVCANLVGGRVVPGR